MKESSNSKSNGLLETKCTSFSLREAPGCSTNLFGEPGDTDFAEAQLLHLKAEKKLKQYRLTVKKAGDALRRAKKKILASGREWEQVFEEKRAKGEFTGTIRKAQFYMKVSREWKKIKDTDAETWQDIADLIQQKRKDTGKSEKIRGQRTICSQLIAFGDRTFTPADWMMIARATAIGEFESFLEDRSTKYLEDIIQKAREFAEAGGGQ